MEKKAHQVGMPTFNRMSKSGLIKKSAGSVAGYIVFAQIILIVALIPIFSFQKVEGKMFSPLAFTLGYALVGSLILSITYVPVMCRWLLRNNIVEKENFISRFFKKTMYSLFQWSSTYKKATLIGFVVLLTLCGVRFMNYGTEFIPKLNEGALYVRATLPNSVNLQESTRLAKEMKDKIRSFEEVKFVLNQVGRPNDGTDLTGLFNIEFHIQLHPEKERNSKLSKDELIEEMRNELQAYPGVIFGFSQPIQDNVEEYVAGVKSALVVKIFG